MKAFLKIKPSQSAARGFTLTELAIVLGIIGLILGAIWVAASAVYGNMRVSRATTELLVVAQAVRSAFASSNTTGSGGGVDMTPSMIRAGVFPTNALDTGLPSTATMAVAPWAQSRINVYSATSPGGVAGDSYQIAFGAIPQSACISLVTSNTGAGRDSGLVAVAGDAGKANTEAGYRAPTVAEGTFPVTEAQAITANYCNNTGLNNLTFTFLLNN